MNRIAPAAILIASALAAPGCVRREVTITSEPSGALVYMSDQIVGRTPVTTEFTWYGDYEVILRLDGHETLKTHTPIRPPWYDVPPWDVVSQALVPWTYHYRVDRHFELQPLALPSEQTLLERADDMQQRTLEPVER